jgi:hypothetical protein
MSFGNETFRPGETSSLGRKGRGNAGPPPGADGGLAVGGWACVAGGWACVAGGCVCEAGG